MDARAFVEPLGDGVYAIDTGFRRPRYDAAYLVVDRGRAAFIDTGTNFAVPRLLAALALVGLGPADVDWVIPTHVHLDHAGGAGALMRALPSAQLAVHARGAPHMIDPRVLQAGAAAVYGAAEVASSYGDLVPVDSSRVVRTHDGMEVEVGSRRLQFIDTPGHARHHHCVWDARTRLWFTGDAFGMSFEELTLDGARFILPASPPVQFEPEPMKQSIGRLLDREPAGLCLTHFGLVRDGKRLAHSLIEQIDEMAALGKQHRDSSDRRSALVAGLAAIYRRHLERHGFSVDAEEKLLLLQFDIQLNVDGMINWLDRRRRPS